MPYIYMQYLRYITHDVRASSAGEVPESQRDWQSKLGDQINVRYSGTAPKLSAYKSTDRPSVSKCLEHGVSKESGVV